MFSVVCRLHDGDDNDDNDNGDGKAYNKPHLRKGVVSMCRVNDRTCAHLHVFPPIPDLVVSNT